MERRKKHPHHPVQLSGKWEYSRTEYYNGRKWVNWNPGREKRLFTGHHETWEFSPDHQLTIYYPNGWVQQCEAFVLLDHRLLWIEEPDNTDLMPECRVYSYEVLSDNSLCLTMVDTGETVRRLGCRLHFSRPDEGSDASGT